MVGSTIILTTFMLPTFSRYLSYDATLMTVWILPPAISVNDVCNWCGTASSVFIRRFTARKVGQFIRVGGCQSLPIIIHKWLSHHKSVQKHRCKWCIISECLYMCFYLIDFLCFDVFYFLLYWQYYQQTLSRFLFLWHQAEALCY